MTKEITRWRHRPEHGDLIQSSWGDFVRWTDCEVLRGNLSLAEEGLASAMQEIAQLKAYAQETALALHRQGAEIERLRDCWSEALANVTARNQEIERLKAKLDEWHKAEAAWNWSVLQLLRQVAAGERRANEAQAILDGHRNIERPSDEPSEQLDEAHANAIATSVVQNVCELPDYTSPEDRPELLQCTVTELHSCVMQAFEQLEYDREMEVGPPGRCLAAGCAQSPMRAAFCEKHNEAIPLEDREDMVAAQRRALKSSGMSALCSHSHCRNPLPHVTGASCTIAMP